MKTSKELMENLLERYPTKYRRIERECFLARNEALLQELKNWAYDKGYPLTIIYDNDIVHVGHIKDGYEKICYGDCKDELTPVIEICEWILEKEKLK